MMLPLLYMDTGTHTQMHSKTHSHTDIYTTHNNTDRHTDTWKHTSRHKTCTASQRHTNTHRDTYKHIYKHIDTQTIHGFIITAGLLTRALTRVLKVSGEVCAAGRGLHPLPFEVGSMVRGLYSVVNR